MRPLRRRDWIAVSRHVKSSVALALLVSALMFTGCAQKADSKASASPSASVGAVDPALLKPTLAQWMRYSGTLQYLKDTNSTLKAMQTTASVQISDTKTLATFVTQMKASGAAAVIIGKSMAAVSSPDAGFNATTSALASSLTALGTTARGLDALQMATVGSTGAAKVRTLITQLTDAVEKTKAVANYASAHAGDTVKF